MTDSLVCTSPVAWIREQPDLSLSIGKNESQLLYGEVFQIKNIENKWALGTSEHDGYEGFVHLDDLGDLLQPPTHIVAVPLSHIYKVPNFKTRPEDVLPMMSKIAMTGERTSGFLKMEEGGWLFEAHLVRIGTPAALQPDYVATALSLLHTPYIYGGQSGLGIDCSGLVRVSLMRAGIAAPRDCNRQVLTLTGDAAPSSFQRGDIVYFKGHVVIMTDAYTCINATARKMTTCIEQIADLLEIYGEIEGLKRLL